MRRRNTSISKEYLQVRETIGDGRYRIESLISDNGVTVAYKGYDTFRNRNVIVKELFPKAIVERNPDRDYFIVCRRMYDEAAFEEMKEHMLKRAKKLIQLYPIEGIANILTCFEEKGTVYVIEEHIPGMTLTEYFFKRHSLKFTVEDIMKQLGPVMETLQRLHKKGIYHGAITPDTIIVSNDHKPILIQLMNPIEDLAKECLQNPAIRQDGYAPVELYLTQASITEATDVYSIAAIFYRYVTAATVPAYYLRINEAEETFEPTEMRTRIMDFQSDAIMKALSLYSFNRFQTVAEFKEAIWPDDIDMESLHSREEVAITQKKLPFWYAFEKKQKRQYWAIVIGLLLLAVVVLIPKFAQVKREESINHFYHKYLDADGYKQCEMLANMKEKQRQLYTNDYLDMDKNQSDESLSENFQAKYYDFQIKKYVSYNKVDQTKPYYEYMKIDYRKGHVIVTYLSYNQNWQQDISLTKTAEGYYEVSESKTDEAGNVSNENLLMKPE